MLITSPHNPRISALRDLHTARGRKKSGLFLMEGPHLLETLLDADIIPVEVYYQPTLLQRTAKGRSLLARLLHTPDLTDKQLDKVRYFKTPEPAREVSIVIQRNFLKRRMIEALKNEILEFLPKRMKSKKKKEVMEI